MRVIVLTRSDATRLLQELQTIEGVIVAGVFLETGAGPKRGAVEKLKRSVVYDGVSGTISKAAAKLTGQRTKGEEEKSSVSAAQDRCRAFLADSQIELYEFEDLHADGAAEAMRRLEPDLGVLYGTNIIKEQIFSIPRMGSINLHQGLAPYYRGGPTVFWELFNGEVEIGLTIHFVAPKVDTGDIVMQRRLPLRYDPEKYGTNFEAFLAEFRTTLSEPSIELLVESIRSIAEGTAQRQVQDITKGKRYRLPTYKQKNELRKILMRRYGKRVG